MSVYFVQSGGYMKIGYSVDPIARSTTVTTTGKRPADVPRGADATLIGWIPGDRLLEGGLHFRFAADHVAGEWFYIDPAVVRELIWEDPCGIDVQRMSALAVFAADRNPGISRDEIANAGIPIEARPFDPSSPMFSFLGGAA